MNKVKYYFSAVFLALFFNSYSQEISKNTLGLRFGGGDGFGTEVSYQRGLENNNRLEIDLGWKNNDNFDGFKLVGVYQWVWNLEGNFNWYAGAGAGLGNYDYEIRVDNDKFNESETFLLAAGQVGIEYNFDEIPLQLSLDTRPELGFGDFVDDLDFDIALGIRYRF